MTVPGGDINFLHLERETGIEPAYLDWQPSALPLSYSRISINFTVKLGLCKGDKGLKMSSNV